MMNSKTGLNELFVWIWLPNAEAPVLCGRIELNASGYRFTYGRNYLQIENAISLDPLELPLTTRTTGYQSKFFGALRDAAPDAWGRRVLEYQFGLSVNSHNNLTEFDYLFHGGDKRIGALHFQTVPDRYIEHKNPNAKLEDLYQAAEAVNSGEEIDAYLAEALLHGTSIGGARPKALISDGNTEWIVKFSVQTDTFPIIRQEALGMLLAQKCGITTADLKLIRILGKDALLVRRFDIYAPVSSNCEICFEERADSDEGKRESRMPASEKQISQFEETSIYTQDISLPPFRRHIISGLTALQLDEMEARYAGYGDLAAFLWKYSSDPQTQCKELYRRMIFNLLIGNTDDHARNHAFFWDGHYADLTPGYDIGVISRIGQSSSQAMIVGTEGTLSTRRNALSNSDQFGVSSYEANQIFDELIDNIQQHWKETCDNARLTQLERQKLLGRAVLSPTVIE